MPNSNCGVEHVNAYQTQDEYALANYQAIEADFERDLEDDLRRQEAEAERRAEANAYMYDPTVACTICGVVLAEPHVFDCPLAEANDGKCDECPWCNPSVVGPALLALFTDKMKGLWLPGLKLSRAGAYSSNPGGLWIAEHDDDGSGDFYGSVRADGTMRMTRTWGNRGANTLKRLAAFGVAELVRIGTSYGFCCYCGKLLTDPTSITLGYGPVCAKYHALPHSKDAAAAVLASAGVAA